MSLKLLFVNASLTDGGSEKAMSLVAQALVACGHDVTMVLLRDKTRTYPIDSRVHVRQFRYTSNGKLQKLKQRVRELRMEIKSGGYDYVVCFMRDLNMTTLIASLGLRQRVVVSERAFPGLSSRTRLSQIVEYWLYHFAYRIVYQTRDAQEFCPPRLAARSIVVPNIIEDQARAVHAGPRSQRIVSVGRLDEQKNFPLLLRSFADFMKTSPGWKLEIYGKGPLEDELKGLSERLGIMNAVDFVGYVDDISRRIRDAGMFVLTSDYEGISNAMTEAMALGLPVICTDCPVGGAALLIENRVSGLLVPVGDQESLTAAMTEVATSDVLADRIAKGASESAARFSSSVIAGMWEEYVLR